jgi:hypothetical protein
VLVSLSHRADKFQNLYKVNQEEHPQSWALDKTGSIRTSTIKYMEVEQQEKDEVFNIKAPDEVLQVHGHAPPSKAEGTFCLIYKNINGICNRLSNNKKLEKARSLQGGYQCLLQTSIKYEAQSKLQSIQPAF